MEPSEQGHGEDEAEDDYDSEQDVAFVVSLCTVQHDDYIISDSRVNLRLLEGRSTKHPFQNQ